MAAKKKTKVEEPVEMVQETLAEVVEEPVEEPKVEPEVPAVSFGVVSNCFRLNVRTKPNPKAKVVAVIEAKTKVRIDNAASDNEWCKIYVKPGVEGYCMRNYLNIQ